MAWIMEAHGKLKPMGEYVTLTPNGGSVPYNEQMEVVASVNASEMINGDYEANILLHSNDKNTPTLRIPIEVKVRGHQPQFDLPEIIDMGSCLLGQSITTTIQLENKGLGVMNPLNISFSNGNFKNKNWGPYSISALSSQELTVLFTPTQSGNENCILTISDETGNSWSTNLFVVVAEPPVIDVQPEVVVHDNLTIGEQVTGNFTLSNTGKYPLKYFFPTFAQGGNTGTTLSKYQNKYGHTFTTHEGEAEFVWEDISATGISHIEAFKNVQTNYVPIELGFAFPFFGKEEHQLYITRYGLLSFDTNSTFSTTPLGYKDESNNSRYISALGIKLDLNGSSNVFSQRFSDHVVIQYQNCGFKTLDYNTWELITVPVTFQIALYDNGDAEFRYKDVEQIDENTRREITLIAIEDKTTQDGLCLNEYYYQNLLARNNMRVRIVNSGYGVVTILNQLQGTLLVGQSVNVDYQVNTSALSQDHYIEKVAIVSNDPSTPVKYALFDLNVVSGGTPDVAVNRTEIHFGQVFQGGAKTETMIVTNNGSLAISLDQIQFTGDRFTQSVASFPYVLRNRHSLYLQVSIQTDQLGDFSEVMTLTDSQLNTYEVVLTGEVIEAPQLVSSLSEIQEELEAGDKKTIALTISNPGGGTLEWMPKGNEWLKVSENNAVLGEEDHDYVLVSNLNGSTDALYNWIDITEDGYELPAADDPSQYFNEVVLPWPITFYGQTYDRIYVTMNGLITFDKIEYQEFFYFGQTEYAPNQDGLSNYISPFWGYVGAMYSEVETKAGFYVKAFSDKIVVSWVDYINGFGIGDPASGQVIFYKDGTIKLQYKVGGLDWTSPRLGIGLENKSASKGTQISFYQELVNKSAYVLVPNAKSVVSPGSSKEYTVTVDATNLIGGTYQGVLNLMNNTPATPSVEIPATLQVNGQPVATTSVDRLDLGELMIQTVFDEWGMEVPKPYGQEFTLTNTGSAALVIDQIAMERAWEMETSAWVYLFVNGPWGSYYAWVNAEDMWTIGYPITLLPGESIRLKGQVAPSGLNSEIADNLQIVHQSGVALVPLTATALFPPVLEVSAQGVTAIAHNTTYTETKALDVSNLNGQSTLKLNYRLSFDRASEAAATQTYGMSKTGALGNQPVTLKQVTALAPSQTRSAEAPMDEEERVLSYTNATSADSFVGFGGGAVLDAATAFEAPSNGFNLTDVESFFSIENNETAEIIVGILSGKDINSANLVYSEKFTVARDGDADNVGKMRRFTLTENQIMLPGERFYVVFSYPDFVKYPQGLVITAQTESNRYYYFDGSTNIWYDLTGISDFSKTGYLVRAIETEYQSAAWVELAAAETSLQIEPGQTAPISLNFIGRFAQGIKSTASLILESNDPKNSYVEVPVVMWMNQAPLFESGLAVTLSARENEAMNVTLQVTDAENDDFTVVAQHSIAGLSVQIVAGEVQLNYLPSYTDAGLHQFTLTATDVHGNESQCAVTLAVANVNRAPFVAEPVADKSYRLQDETDLIQLNRVFADADQEELTYAMSQSVQGVVEVFMSQHSMYLRPLAVGTTQITLTATDPEGLSATVTFAVEVKNRVGIDELKRAQIQVYPVPADKQVFVKWSDVIPGNMVVKLTTADGKVLSTTTVETNHSAGEQSVSLDGLASGVYFVELVSGSESITKQILKK